MEIADYRCFDVKITKELHGYGKAHGEVFYQARFGQKRRVKVNGDMVNKETVLAQRLRA